MNRDVGVAYNASPRDEKAEFSPLTGRLRRAVDNHFEALALFTIAVVVLTLSGKRRHPDRRLRLDLPRRPPRSTSRPTPSAGRRGGR